MCSTFRLFLPAPHRPARSVLYGLAALGLFSEVTQAATAPSSQDTTTPHPKAEQPPKQNGS